MLNTWKNVEKNDTSLGENTENSTNDFNMIMDKKFEEFKTYIISELTESVKHIIQIEIHGILKVYKDQLENVAPTVEILQQHVSNLKHENSILQDKVKNFNQEFDSRCDESEHYSRRLCLRVQNVKKNENDSSEVVLESIRESFDEANVVIPDAYIDRAHHVSKTNDTVIVRSTTFRHRTMFFHNRKALKGGVTVHRDLTRSRLKLLMKANKYVKDISNGDFAYSDINCHLNVQFKNRREGFFDSMEDLISNIYCLKG